MAEFGPLALGVWVGVTSVVERAPLSAGPSYRVVSTVARGTAVVVYNIIAPQTDLQYTRGRVFYHTPLSAAPTMMPNSQHGRLWGTDGGGSVTWYKVTARADRIVRNKSSGHVFITQTARL